ncbi:MULTISPECIES: hypothetical protein [unclassified Treponema]|uniref:hypothetical protein n=1 Tax=unclassified Treponema TaxID=2638727 RepID=UPI0020A3E6EF|nr:MULTISPECIES: hypothetical protein [unclassified Treponema]
MKKVLLILLILIINIPCFSQVINIDYFPKNNDIDKQYEIDMQSWSTNYEWQIIIGKYSSIWERQMYLEMERLISIIPHFEKKIRKNQKKWEETIEQDFKLIAANVDFNKIGREVYIGEYCTARIELYRNKAIYYLCLYYTIKDQISEDNLYTDIKKTELAK